MVRAWMKTKPFVKQKWFDELASRADARIEHDDNSVACVIQLGAPWKSWLLPGLFHIYVVAHCLLKHKSI